MMKILHPLSFLAGILLLVNQAFALTCPDPGTSGLNQGKIPTNWGVVVPSGSIQPEDYQFTQSILLKSYSLATPGFVVCNYQGYFNGKATDDKVSLILNGCFKASETYWGYLGYNRYSCMSGVQECDFMQYC